MGNKKFGIKVNIQYEMPPEQLQPAEKMLPYVKQLLQVYSKETGQVYKTKEQLKKKREFPDSYFWK